MPKDPEAEDLTWSWAKSIDSEALDQDQLAKSARALFEGGATGC